MTDEGEAPPGGVAAVEAGAGGGWEELVSSALLGTDRRPVPPAGEPAEEAPVDDPAAVLLERAAPAVVRLRAGRMPGRAAPVEPAPHDAGPFASDAAAARLGRILGGEQAALLPEWLGLAADRGLTVPPHLLPDLLDHGARDTGLRPAVAAVAGARGRWLAALNPAWSYFASVEVTAGEPGEVWEYGAPGQRVAYLSALRGREPARARELLAEVWDKEPADRRKRLLQALEIRLSADDEPFLEELLNDRSSLIRALALTFLSRLPDSALGRRLIPHALRAVRIDGGRSADRRARPIVVVDPPQRLDDGLRRDLNLGRSAGRGTASAEHRREWLHTLITYTPLSAWLGHLGDDPASVMHALVNGAAEQMDVIDALGNAALVQHNADWARGMIPYLLGPLGGNPALRSRGDSLVRILPAEEQRARTAQQLAAAPDTTHVLSAVQDLRVPWGTEVGALVLERLLADRANTGESASLELHSLCRLAAQRLDPALHSRMPPPNAAAADVIHQFGATLRFRLDMHQELS
ncbi:DUF5691 domain-containing protein [Allonocardiopsis opalescens]|uniref:Uncharacterized protein n=1 Tax=Allonocardiopsis opalescens TaxID=1144618 RepID=A0A2T0PY10_9ACTN|nr:DUF5691 domain-containing protein [Allonocardiopsis opalescens]PRX96296.1 hypothetical protein CLV72_108303 [Allonocardiopsis opalescens]